MSELPRDRRIFVDTSAYFSLASPRDELHADASAIMRELIRARRRFVTTNFIPAELHALMVARGSVDTALESIERIRSSPAMTVVRVRSADEERAIQILRRYRDKTFSMTDALSFSVMERLGVSIAFSLDHHFAQYGWRLVAVEASG